VRGVKLVTPHNSVDMAPPTHPPPQKNSSYVRVVILMSGNILTMHTF